MGVRAAGHNRDVGRRLVSASVVTMDAMEVVLRTRTPDGVEVILSALYAKILEEHPGAADLYLIDRTVREPLSAGPIRGLAASGSSVAKAASGSLPWWISRAFLPFVATLRDGRRLRVDRHDIAELLD